ncbi:MAG TPA: DUF3857 domain-containing transglutaminase family protein [Candidatus Angelobacter sp.]|nr:DUF3857 domain-containing transglutaminase family protein [Candidatus Angelobacter sp.]
MHRRAIRCLAAFLVAGLSVPLAAAGTPDWLRVLAQQPQKKYADDANAVVLLDNQETTVQNSGEIVTHERIAYRILRPEGRHYAEYQLDFDSETKISSFRGWSITAQGQEYEAKEKDSFERSLTSYEVFSDEKVKVLILPGAEVGTVVGFEYERKKRPYVFQDFCFFQERIPVERSSYALRLPPGWEYSAQWINHAPQDPLIQNGSYVWELKDLPRIETEYNEPPYRALAATLLVNFFSDKVKSQTFRSWNDLALWHAQLTAGTREPSPTLQQKVQELAPATMPMFDRMKALARFAQRDVRYAAIEIGIGGLKPHPAAEVFAHRYGDCKDKATVLAAMLAQIGVKSFYMPVHDDRGIFTEKTPPNLGFNHVILAIQLPEASYPQALPAVYEHPKLGHLLIFDPTNEFVPFGDLPPYEQDSYALLVTDNGGELIHLPVSAPERNAINRTAHVKLLPDGTLQGEIEEVRTGYSAMAAREYLQNESHNDRKKILEHFWGPTIGSFKIDSFDLVNTEDIEKEFIIRYKFTSDHYAKNAGPLLLVRPHVIGEMAGGFDASKPRHYPYEFYAPFSRTERVEITLPEGYKVDELPAPAHATPSFAEYTSKTEDIGNVLKYSRDYKMRATTVPLEKIDQLKRLFGEIMVDEKNMAVLKKAN